MARVFFDYEPGDDGVVLRLFDKPWAGKARVVPPLDWTDHMADGAFAGASRILALLDDADSPVETKDDAVFIDHATVASLNEPQALGLGLPPSVRFPFQVDTKNLVTDPDFRISGRWIGEANRPLRVRRRGAFLHVEERGYRLPEPLFGLVEAIDDFATTDTADSNIRMERLAVLQSLIPQEAREQVAVDSYFTSFRILHASAFSLSLRTHGRSFDFDPVLFGRRVLERIRTDGGPVSEAEGLLTEHQQEVFAKERFRTADEARSSYVIESGVYVHLDPSLREALDVVRRMQNADPESRKRFAQVPQLYLKEALSESLSADDVERLFIETEQYSARVIDVGVWSAPVLPWIKGTPNDWLPEKFGLQIGEQYVILGTEELGPLREQIREARAAGSPFVEFGEERTRIPATFETEQSLTTLIGIVRPEPEGDDVGGKDLPTPEQGDTKQKHVLIVEENFEGVGFKRHLVARAALSTGLPKRLKATLKRHQQSGLDWLRETWRRGYPGVLLADDMGLGKTLQALAFLSLLNEARTDIPLNERPKGPTLIVAPTGLLANWKKEHDHHLHEPGLGEVCRAYGRHLAVLKTASTRDIDRGAPSLDQRRIQQANWVLTTYETLRDYHLSFAAIPFSCIVFDEMQKVKAPTSLLTRAAKTLNGDFMVGLTGTPIENQLSDLWCIIDIISPGFLDDLKTFNSKYASDDIEALERLRATLLDANKDGPAPVLRRMKTEHLDGLPEKQIHIRKRPMPESQAKVYAEVVAKAKQPDSGPMLETLHLLRGVSLHPIWPPAGDITDQRAFIAQSARLAETFDILDEIASRREKVLLFLESLDLQEHLALIIKKRYGLRRRPMQINGEIAGEKRQKLVDNFQAERGVFDVMILSPRAGGVGLTLTTVIHLSRWWNPAVEDQCTDRVYRIGQDRTVHVYYPMAVHPSFRESSFDELLNDLLARKRTLSSRMLVPPVNLKQDQKWFAENLGRTSSDVDLEPANVDDIDVMEPRAFETWALRRSATLGWEASRTPISHDGGADGILEHRLTRARAIVQCKHKQDHTTACGSEAVDDVLRARSKYLGTARLFVLTNAERFSRSARERAEMHGVSLIGRRELTEWPRQLL